MVREKNRHQFKNAAQSLAQLRGRTHQDCIWVDLTLVSRCPLPLATLTRSAVRLLLSAGNLQGIVDIVDSIRFDVGKQRLQPTPIQPSLAIDMVQ